MGRFNEGEEEKKGASRTMEVLGTIGFGGVAAALLNGNNGCGGGLLGNLFGNNGNCQKVSALESGMVYESSKNYADQVGKEVYNALYVAQKEAAERAGATAASLATLRTELEAERRCTGIKDEKQRVEIELAVTKATTPLLLRLQRCEDSIPLVQERCMGAIAAERDARKCADSAIVRYVNATFYPKLVAGVTPTTTTTEQPVYNPLPCQCGCGQPAA